MKGLFLFLRGAAVASRAVSSSKQTSVASKLGSSSCFSTRCCVCFGSLFASAGRAAARASPLPPPAKSWTFPAFERVPKICRGRQSARWHAQREFELLKLVAHEGSEETRELYVRLRLQKHICVTE